MFALILLRDRAEETTTAAADGTPVTPSVPDGTSYVTADGFKISFLWPEMRKLEEESFDPNELNTLRLPPNLLGVLPSTPPATKRAKTTSAPAGAE